MNLEIVELDKKSAKLYKWPDNLYGKTMGVGVIETREIVTWICTIVETQRESQGERAISHIYGQLSSSVVDLLNTVCSFCNNRSTTIEKHTFYINADHLSEFRKLYKTSRLGAYTAVFGVELFESQNIAKIDATLVYPR